MRGEKERKCFEYMCSILFTSKPFQGKNVYSVSDDEFLKCPYVYEAHGRGNIFFGMTQEEIRNFENVFRCARPNPNLNDFPDFVSDKGIIEHFQVTSSQIKRKGGSEHQRKHAEFQKQVDAEESAWKEKMQQSPSPYEVQSMKHGFQYPKHSYQDFIKSFKKNWEHHVSRIDAYKGHKDITIFMVEYLDGALHMCENFTVSDLKKDAFWGDMLRQEKYAYYRLSLDKELLNYIYTFKNKVDYVVLVTDMAAPEVIQIDTIPDLMKLNPNGFTIASPGVIGELQCLYGMSIPIAATSSEEDGQDEQT